MLDEPDPVWDYTSTPLEGYSSPQEAVEATHRDNRAGRAREATERIWDREIVDVLYSLDKVAIVLGGGITLVFSLENGVADWAIQPSSEVVDMRLTQLDAQNLYFARAGSLRLRKPFGTCDKPWTWNRPAIVMKIIGRRVGYLTPNGAHLFLDLGNCKSLHLCAITLLTNGRKLLYFETG